MVKYPKARRVLLVSAAIVVIVIWSLAWVSYGLDVADPPHPYDLRSSR